MKSANQSLLTLLQQSSFSEGKPEQCALAVAAWKAQYQLTELTLAQALTQFAAQLLNGVRTTDMSPANASELLARLIALSDLEIPPSVFALQEVLQNLADDSNSPTDQQLIKKEMGRILPTMPRTELHESDRCRYTGRYQDSRRTA